MDKGGVVMMSRVCKTGFRVPEKWVAIYLICVQSLQSSDSFWVTYPKTQFTSTTRVRHIISQGSSRRVLLDAIQCKKKFKIFIAFSRVPALDILLSSKSNMLQSAITPPIILYRWRHSSEIWVLYST